MDRGGAPNATLSSALVMEPTERPAGSQPKSAKDDAGAAAGFGVIAGLASILLLQLGAALSKHAMEIHGALEITWLRLAFAALILLIVTRPKAWAYSSAQWRTALALGAAVAVTNLCYYRSLLYLPIGVATSIQFLGPLAVAAFYRARLHPAQLIWPIVAGIGVLLLTVDLSPDRLVNSAADPIGVAWALGAAVGWGVYIIFLKKTGTLFTGLDGLTMSLAMAAAITAPALLLGSEQELSQGAIQSAFGLAILVPLLPYALELWALRRLDPRRFGMLMCAEPIISACLGWVILSQSLTETQIAGICLTAFALLKVMQRKADS